MIQIGYQVHNLDLIEWHYNSIKDLKRYFISNSGVSKYESHKIWSSWIITHRSLSDQVDSFLPSINIVDDQQILYNLVEKGSTRDQAREFYQNFIQMCETLVQRLQDPPQSPQSDVEPKLQYNDSSQLFELTYKSIRHHITPILYKKLETLYMNGRTTINFRKNLLVLLNHYALLEGLSFQWGVPPKVHEALRYHVDIKGELFASPINCISPNFWSLFQIDKLFGSRGNFFKAGYHDFVSYPQNMKKILQGGIYQVNPPFIEALFVESSLRISKYLEQAQKDGIELSFIYFMPNWLDSAGYQQLKNSRFFIDEEIIKGAHHSYFESNTQRYIKVYFNTHILVLASDIIAGRRKWSFSVKKKIRENFR